MADEHAARQLEFVLLHSQAGFAKPTNTDTMPQVAMPHPVDLKQIYPHGGDRRTAFEELSCLLFSREFANLGAPIRRHGAGGDRGLESIIADSNGRPLIGIQAKFFNDRLGSTQWRDLDESICRVIGDKANHETLCKVIVVLPRNLTPVQGDKWVGLVSAWQTKANHFCSGLDFVLWDEDRVRALLFEPQNRGALLHYFEYPDFDRARCTAKTIQAIQRLGDRYQPQLHTPTEAEDMLHCFLRSERFRQQYLEEARNQLGDGLSCREASNDWSDSIKVEHAMFVSALEQIKPHLSDGTILPTSVDALAAALEQATKLLQPLLRSLSGLIPEKEPSANEDQWRYGYDKHPAEQVYNSFAEKSRRLSGLAGFLRHHHAADCQSMLLYGGPGLGKTHVLAEISNRYAEQGGVVLFFEGATFLAATSPWEQILRRSDFPGSTVRDFLATFAALAEQSSLNALICIDALNETSDRDYWKRFLLEFASELQPYPEIKLLVSCRSDYLRQTLPQTLADRSLREWAFAEHTGLGVEVLEAMPKYLRAYGVEGFAMPPLTSEFRSPLFLRIFCEAYRGQCPDVGSLSLPVILRHYASRKAAVISARIDCHMSAIEGALVELGSAIMLSGGKLIAEGEAQSICRKHHAAPEASRSLYSALISDGILLELPGGSGELLQNAMCVRFTYERVWDYFLSRHLLPVGGSSTPTLATMLNDEVFLSHYAGVVSMLAVRLAEEYQVEVCDLGGSGQKLNWVLAQAFLESLSWRTTGSVTARTKAILKSLMGKGVVRDELELFLSFAINSAHPWNANWLHEKLLAMPLAERDRGWTFWINEKLIGWSHSQSLDEIRAWAERANLDQVPDDQILLLGTAMAWCLTTTAVGQRTTVALSLCRVLAGRSDVAAKLFDRFAGVDDPYVRERVLLACLGSAQHAQAGDLGLGKLAGSVHHRVFSGDRTEPHLLIRHYASEICLQAEQKKVLPRGIDRDSYRPPWESKWPRIWSAKKVTQQGEIDQRQIRWLYHSVEPEGAGVRYGDFGRYVMQAEVEQFQKLRLKQSPGEGPEARFDAQIARRYVIQRVFELGWDWTKEDTHPDGAGESHDNHRVERLSKKYQWIALYEFLGFQSDHFHFIDWNDKPRKFVSAKQIQPRDLIDPYIVEPRTQVYEKPWIFVRPSAPWWRGGVDPLPRPMSPDEQRVFARRIESDNPRKLIELSDGKHTWLALSSYHHLHEPEPFWESRFMGSRVGVEWAVQSYLVRSNKFDKLVEQLSRRQVDNGQLWFHEPSLGQSLSVLKTYPHNQEELEQNCGLNGWRETSGWKTGAISTTCQCETSVGSRSDVIGSIPSPVLARMGDLVWTGKALDFTQKGKSEIVTSHFGPDYRGVCAAKREALLSWLVESGYRIVWRCYGFKYRPREGDECNARVYWMTFTLDDRGSLRLCKGATSACPTDLNDEEPLPWS